MKNPQVKHCKLALKNIYMYMTEVEASNHFIVLQSVGNKHIVLT